MYYVYFNVAVLSTVRYVAYIGLTALLLCLRVRTLIIRPRCPLYFKEINERNARTRKPLADTKNTKWFHRKHNM